MAFNGSGLFNRIHNWVTDAANAINITDTRMDAEQDGFATGLSTCITKDGQTVVTADLPMASFKHLVVGNAALGNQYAAAGQVQNGAMIYAADAGAADAYTVALAPVVTAYAAGQVFAFKVANANTGASTLAVNGLAAKAIQKRGAALTAADIQANDIVVVVYDGTQFQMISPADYKLNSAANGGALILTDVASAVNELGMTNSIAGEAPEINATGSDTDIDVDVIPKGTGVLKVNGVEVTTTATAGENGDWEFISGGNATSSTSVDFTGLTSAYSAYKVIVSGLLANTDDTGFGLRIGTGAGPTYQAGASDYSWVWSGFSNTEQSNLDVADSQIQLTSIGSGAGVSDIGTEPLAGEITIYDPSYGILPTIVLWSLGYINASSINVHNNGMGFYTSITAVTAIRFLMSSGNIAVGQFRLYGLKDT